MIIKIFKTNTHALNKKFIIVIKYAYYSVLSKYLFSKRYEKYKKNGFEFKKLNRKEKKEYRDYWHILTKKAEIKTIGVAYANSNKFNKKIIPENVFFTHIELTLNHSKSLHFLQHKSIYNKWYRNSNLFPYSYFHRISGVYFDKDLKALSNNKELEDIINSIIYPVIIKPNVDTSGGKNVYFIKSKEELLNKIGSMTDFVVQEEIQQSPLLNEIYPKLNTVRVCVYKSVEDNKFHILNAAIRMGVNGSLDNVGDGGLSCYINQSGYLNEYATDYFAKKFYKHPNSKMSFGFELPFYTQLCYNSLQICENIIEGRLISLDMCLDQTNTWRAIEVNLLGNTIRFAQNAGVPFLGKYTDEIIEYCSKNHWTYKDQKLF